MQPDPTLAAHSQHFAMDVKKSALSYDAISFGPYQVANIDLDWGRSSSARSGSFTQSRSTKDYAYTVSSAGTSLNVKCKYKKETSGASLSGMSLGGHKVSLHCDLSRADAVDGAFDLRSADNGYAGEAKAKERTFAVASRHAVVGGTTSSPAGYDVRAGDNVLAEVQTVNEPEVWLDTAAPADDAIAAAAIVVAVYFFEREANR